LKSLIKLGFVEHATGAFWLKERKRKYGKGSYRLKRPVAVINAAVTFKIFGLLRREQQRMPTANSGNNL
jgi:hypothetical protein